MSDEQTSIGNFEVHFIVEVDNRGIGMGQALEHSGHVSVLHHQERVSIKADIFFHLEDEPVHNWSKFFGGNSQKTAV